MGFHLLDRVYRTVRGTSPKAQSVLAYLAHRADDKGERKCYPDTASIEEATHFGHTAVRDALNELREANLLAWKSGGRLKGAGGRALANEYVFNLPVDNPSNVNKSSPSSSRQTANAVAATRPMHTPPDGQCIHRQAATINHTQKGYHPSVIGETEAESDVSKRKFEELGESWEQSKKGAKERVALKEKGLNALVEEAMAAAGVSDFENRRIYTSTLMRRDLDDCLEVIMRFASQCRSGEHKGLSNPAAALNRLLSGLPVVN